MSLQSISSPLLDSVANLPDATGLPFSESEIQALRAATPAAGAFVHLNHASTSLPDHSTLAAQHDFMALEARIGMHRALDSVADLDWLLRAAIASMLGTQASQIALTESASRGWALALSAVSPERRLQMFVSPQEWGGNVNNILARPRIAMTLMAHAPDAAWDAIVHDALEQRDRTAVPVVSLPLIASTHGAIHRLAGVADAVQRANGWFFVDASQAVGQIPVNVQELGADVLVFPARKWLRGPRGVAALYLSQRALAQFGAPALVDIHGSRTGPGPHGMGFSLRLDDDARRFQLYEHHPALRLGMLAAVRALRETGVERIHAHTRQVCGHLRAQIMRRWHDAHADAADSGLLCLSFPGLDAASLVQRLWASGYNTACLAPRYAPLAHHGAQDAAGTLRISPHVMTLPAEIDTFVEVLAEALKAGTANPSPSGQR